MTGCPSWSSASAGPPGSTRPLPRATICCRSWFRPRPACSRRSRCPPMSTTCATTAPSWSPRSRPRTPSRDTFVTRSQPAQTPYGEGRLDLYAARGTTATLLLSHGAGNGVEARDLAALADAMPRHGVTVALFEQPWRLAGRKIASPPATLDVGLEAAYRVLRPRGALVVGGRSAGARSAARCATGLGAAGCLAISFP